MIDDCELMDRNLSCDLSERIISANDTDTFKAVASQLVSSLRFDLDSKSVEAGLERSFRDGETGDMLTIKLVFRSIILFLKLNLVHFDPALVFSQSLASRLGRDAED